MKKSWRPATYIFGIKSREEAEKLLYEHKVRWIRHTVYEERRHLWRNAVGSCVASWSPGCGGRLSLESNIKQLKA